MKTSRFIIVTLVTAAFLSAFASTISTGTVYASNNNASTSTNHMTYVWMFGYVGTEFYPTTELGLNESQVLHVVWRISSHVGGPDNLTIVSAVDIMNGAHIPPSDYSTVKNYVSSLHVYASHVYGRISLSENNLTSTQQGTLDSWVNVMVNDLGLDGVWIDYAPGYYAAIGQLAFNNMMQTLVTEYPNTIFMLNEASHLGLPIPLPETTWANHTFVTPTISPGTYNGIQTGWIAALNVYWSGRVIVHWDADAQNPLAPSGIFANQNSTTEVSTMQYVVNQGHLLNYNVLYPILGGWTSNQSSYQGNLYNSMPKGNFDRSTLRGFIGIMENSSAPIDMN